MYLKETVARLLKNKNRSLSWLALEMGKSFDGLKLSLVKGSIKYLDIILMAKILETHPGELFESEQGGYSPEEWRNALEEGETQYKNIKNELTACRELNEALKTQVTDKERIIALLTQKEESAYFNKSGRRAWVRSRACSWRHSSISFWLPLNKISGTLCPRHSAGRVYIGASNKSSWKESERAEVSSLNTPGMSRTTASTNTAAASSPPEST